MTIARRGLQELVRQWRRQTTAREGLFALSAAIALSALVLVCPAIPKWVPFIGFFVLLGWLLTRSRPWTLDEVLLTRHLDRVYPTFEESSALWLRAPERLTLIERLQLKRLDNAVVAIATEKLRSGTAHSHSPIFGSPPRGLHRAARWCLLGSILMLALADMTVMQRKHLRAVPTLVTALPAAQVTAVSPKLATGWPKIVAGKLFIVPPAYTAHPARRVDGLNAEVEEGASVTWRLELDRPIRDARLVFGEAGADALPLHRAPGAGEQLEATRPVFDAGLYHLAATLLDGTAWSPPELFSLQIIRDRPPMVRILQPELSRTLLDSPKVPFTVECLAADDYGLADAHLVATVAKGSGEAVKFREQSITFDTNEAAATGPGELPGGRRLVKTLDLAKLGLEPGDELYFYVEVRDNRQPNANVARSETRFVTIKGPSATVPSVGLGVAGVNLVPQYFRSERQLIIDTEKLIADQSSFPPEEYRRRSNDLGVDQQLLRLRYGQFVGEEFDQSAINDHAEVHLDPLQAAPAERTGPRAAASVALRFQQEHTEQDREGIDPENETGLRAAPERPLSADQVRAPFVDQHDSQDKATFFDHQTKGTLKDALGDMWQAEGALRTTRPQEALSPEHRALDILKDLQQSARAYVQHVGFEPPPLNIPARRLQGDAAGVPPNAAVPLEIAPKEAAGSLPDVRAALAVLPWDQPSLTLTQTQVETLRRIEPALTAAAVSRPDLSLEGLRALRRILAGESDSAESDFSLLKQALFRELPAAEPLPNRRTEAAPSLARSYFLGLSEAALDKAAP